MKKEKGGKAGAFLAGVALATIAGGYFLFGSKNSKRNRERVEAWTLQAKSEVLDSLRKMKDISKDKYEQIVDTVSEKYSEMKEVGKEKAEKFKKELRDHWKNIEEDAESEMEAIERELEEGAQEMEDEADSQ